MSKWYKPPHDKTNKMACAPSEDSDQPGHSPSLIRVFTVGMKKARVLSYPLNAQRRFWSDWAHSHFVGFVMRQVNSLMVYFTVKSTGRRYIFVTRKGTVTCLRIRNGLRSTKRTAWHHLQSQSRGWSINTSPLGSLHHLRKKMVGAKVVQEVGYQNGRILLNR